MKAIYEVQTFNDALHTENRIHSDEVAQQFGFEGALVSGVVVFGHMTYLPMKELGVAWLTDNEAEVRFVRPAYDGDVLTMDMDSTVDGCQVNCMNEAKTSLATLTSRPNTCFPSPSAAVGPALEESERLPISWDNLQIDKPAAAHFWQPDAKTNLALAEQLEDDLPLYRGDDALVHPFWILRQCNAAFAREFVLPAWIHVGSKIQFHQPLKVGDDIETRLIPTRKWKHKGHQFTTLYIAFIADGTVSIEVEHTAIFRIAPQRD